MWELDYLPQCSGPKRFMLDTDRTFQMIFLFTAGWAVRNEYHHRRVLVLTLEAVFRDTREHKCLVINDDKNLRLSSWDWEYVFSQLRSDDQSLEAIVVMCGEYNMLSAVCNRIGYLLATSSTLEFLWFEGPELFQGPELFARAHFCLSAGVVKTLSEGLMQTKSLRGVGLGMGVLDTEFAEVLNNAFTENMQNTSVEWFDLASEVERLDMVLEALLLSNRFKNLKKIRIVVDANRVSEHTVDNFQMLPELIRRWERSDFDTSREVRVCFEVCNRLIAFGGDSVLELEQRVLSCWDNWVRANESALMLKTELQITMLDKVKTELEITMVNKVRMTQGEWEVLINEMPKRFTQLKSLHIALIAWDRFESTWARDLDMDHVSLLCKGIESADSVESISTRGPDNVLVNCYPPLFQCLQYKQRLKQLSIDGEWYVDQAFRCLMDFLQVNIYVEEVHFLGDKSEWPSDAEGKKVLVSEALRRNREQAAYFSTMRDAQLAFEEAKAARVFLCGNPHAGKTTLRVTMMKTRQKESRIVKYFTRKLRYLRKPWSGKGLPLKRTKGVDVELLRDDNQMQVSLWDLAGQEIFRALQSLLLPVVTQACVFVFVFSPFEDGKRHIKEHLDVSFKLELRSWLRFVASHYPITGTFLPEVLVIITHKDKMKQYGRDLGSEFAPIVAHFRTEYGQALNLYVTPWHVDAWNEEEVTPFVEEVCTLVSKVLRKTTPQAPSACCKLISEILDSKHASSSEMVARPVWSIPDFYTHISKRLEVNGVGSFDQSVDTQRTVLETVIRYMHDVGSIFHLPKCQLVVGDINWLTHKFLGVLISEGHGFHSKILSGDFSSEDGVVTKGDLDAILKELSKICQKKKVIVDPQVLLDLLVNLDLCYPTRIVDGVQEYFMPTIFGRKNARGADLTWTTGPTSEAEWHYFGYRLLCADTNTASLTAATFPRFQIRFFKDMVANDETCILQRDVIRLDHSRKGYSIIIENAEEGAHIDVLFQFSKLKSRDEAIEYARKHILQEFRKFCASPEGCRGVTLVTAIIRPECVRRLTPQQYRKEQIILETELKNVFKKTVEEKLKGGQVTWPRGDKEGDVDIFDCEHFWKEVLDPAAGLFKHSQQAIELLSGKEVEEMMKPVKERSRIALEQLTEVEQQLDNHLQHAADGFVTRLSVERHSWRSEESSSSCTQDDKKFSEIHEHLNYMEERLKEHIDKRVASIRRDIQQLQESVHSTLLSIITKIDTMMGYSRALEDARVPRLPFITLTDIRFSQRVKGVVQFGTPVRLHLMCESRFRPHIVDDQPGLKLTIGNENKEWLRRISVNALKIFWTLLKAGIDSQLPGAGSFIPELGDLSSNLVQVDERSLEELKDAKLSSLPSLEGSEMAKDVWKFLGRTIQSEKIPEDFKLQLVRYNPGTVAADQAYAWLCQKCIENGENNHVLKSI